MTVKVRDDHGGCRSWLEISRDLPFEGTPGALRRGVRARVGGDHRDRATPTASPHTPRHPPARRRMQLRRVASRGCASPPSRGRRTRAPPPPPRRPPPRRSPSCRTCPPSFPASPGRSRCPTEPTTAAASATCCRRARAATTTPSSSPRSSARAGRSRTAATSSGCTATSSTRRPACAADQVGRYFKDATFGVRPGDVERRYSPRADVTIVRDKGFGVPHVYGATRDGAMFGARLRGRRGPAVLHGRAAPRRARRAGGLRRRLERRAWTPSSGRSRRTRRPTCERQADQLDDVLGAPGAVIQRDVEHYVAGVNKYIAEARLEPDQAAGRVRRDRPAAGAGAVEARPTCSRPPRSSAASSARAAARSSQWTEIRQALRDRFGKRARHARVPRLPLGRGPGGAGDGARGPLPLPAAGAQAAQGQPRGAGPGLAALPRRRRGAAGRRAARAASALPGGGLMALPATASNALLVSGRESASGQPLMVAGPQTGYFNPQILMEQEVHAPGERGPAADRRAAARASSGSTSTSSSAAGATTRGARRRRARTTSTRSRCELCDDTHYRYRGRCEPIEVLEKTVSWTPSLADQTPAGSQTLRAERTKLGLVAGARHGPRQAGDLHEAALDVLPRGRLGGGLHRLQHADRDHRPGVVPARREQDRLHVQLVLRGLRADLLLQLGRQPGARAAGSTTTCPSPRAIRAGAAGTRTRWSSDVTPPAAHPQVDRPALPRQLEQQAGARLRVVGRRTRTRRSTARSCCRTACARRIARRAQADAAGPDRHHGGRGHRRPARARRCCRSRCG